MKPSPSIGGMSLGMGQQLHEQSDRRGRQIQDDRRMLTMEERPRLGLAVRETQGYSYWGDWSSSCKTIFRCRMNRMQWSLLSYSSSSDNPTNVLISNNKMCNRMTAMAIMQSY